MATANSLKRQVERLLEVARSHRPKDDYRLSAEWEVIQSVMLHALVPFPDAERTALAVIADIERMNYCPDYRAITVLFYQGLKPFVEARIAIASALVEAEKAA